MRTSHVLRVVALALGFLTIASACADGESSGGDKANEAAPARERELKSTAAATATTAELTAADLEAYAKGIARESELVRAAQDRARTATTPQARGEAQQAQWEDQTIPEGAKAAGIAPERYRAVRTTVNTTFQWLDFQGKIDGPMELDTARAAPDMKARFARDPFDALSPDSRAALQGQMNRLVPAWLEYVKLTAVAG
jgi:hypothetical protein